MPAWGDYPTSSRSASLCPSPGERARLALIENHYRSDALIAEAARCSRAAAAHARRLLEDEGIITYLETRDRAARTRTPCVDPLPFIPPAPPLPAALAHGSCVTHPRGPRLWESTRNPTDRAEALAICAVCPALQPCREWALSLSPLLDRQIGILGGLLVADRDRIRRARREAAQRGRAARAARRAVRAVPRNRKTAKEDLRP